MNNKTYKIEIPYFDKIEISKKRKAKYYTIKDKKIPKKIQNNSTINGIFVDIEGNKILKNKKSIDKPRYITINGQSIYNGKLMGHARNLVARKVKEIYNPYISSLPKIISNNISIELEIRLTNTKYNWDCSNKWIYIKWFEDILVEKGIIPDDNIEYIKSSGKITFIQDNVDLLVFYIKC